MFLYSDCLAPTGPYALRPTITQWKNAKLKIMALNSDSFLQPSKNRGSLTGSALYILSSPARRPAGASFVIFMPLSVMAIGKIGDGYDVNHKRKSGLTSSAISSFSHICSNLQSTYMPHRFAQSISATFTGSFQAASTWNVWCVSPALGPALASAHLLL